jgi:hypothetical protein
MRHMPFPLGTYRESLYGIYSFRTYDETLLRQIQVLYLVTLVIRSQIADPLSSRDRGVDTGNLKKKAVGVM